MSVRVDEAAQQVIDLCLDEVIGEAFLESQRLSTIAARQGL